MRRQLRNGLLRVLAAALAPALLSCLAHAASAEPHGDRATSHRRFDDPAYWSRIFDDPKRDAWQKPAEVVEALAVRKGAIVADLGAGTGYFERHLARAVGPEGAVLAIEVEPALVAHIRDRAEKEGWDNVVPVLASRHDPRLPGRVVELVLIVDTWHHIDGRVRYFRRLRRHLAPGGRIAVVDWLPGDLPEGPPPEHKLPPEQVVGEMRQAGFRLVSDRSELLPYQYFLIFEPAERRPPATPGS